MVPATKADATPLLAGNNSNNQGYNSVVETTTNEIDVSDAGSSESDFEEHGTTPTEAFLNLLKGYFGAGMLRSVQFVVRSTKNEGYGVFVP